MRLKHKFENNSDYLYNEDICIICNKTGCEIYAAFDELYKENGSMLISIIVGQGNYNLLNDIIPCITENEFIIKQI